MQPVDGKERTGPGMGGLEVSSSPSLAFQQPGLSPAAVSAHKSPGKVVELPTQGDRGNQPPSSKAPTCARCCTYVTWKTGMQSPVLQMRRLRLRGVKGPAPGHITSKCRRETVSSRFCFILSPSPSRKPMRLESTFVHAVRRGGFIFLQLSPLNVIFFYNTRCSENLFSVGEANCHSTIKISLSPHLLPHRLLLF